jgi:hypothetical protein
MAENIEFKLRVIDDKLSVALEQNEKRAKSLGTAINVALGSFAASAAIKGISLVADGFDKLNSFVKESVDAASESEQALKRLEVALSQTGQLSEDNVKSFQDFANQIQETTAFEDDFVIANIALIQSLARLDQDGLKRATKAAIDLSVAIGIDLETASRLLAKASEGNTTALGRLGIEFQKGASNAETFANILTTIENRFGGAAQAQAKTFAGAIAQLTNTWGDLKENVGGALTQNAAVIAGFNLIKTATTALSEALSSAFGKVNQDAIATLIRIVIDGLNAVVLVTDSVIRVFNILAATAQGAFATLNAAILAPFAAITNLIALIPGVSESIKKAAQDSANDFNVFAKSAQGSITAIRDAFSGETFLSKISGQIADARVAFDVLYNDIKLKRDELNNNPVNIFDENEKTKLEVLRAELLAIDNEYYLAANQLEEQERIAEKERFGVKTEEDLRSLQDFELSKSELIYQAAIDRANLTLKGEELGIAKQRALREKEIRDLQTNAKTRSDIRQLEIKDQQAFFAAATSLASSKNKELAAIGKAAAITEIAIKTPQAVASSFAFGTRIGGPALGAALGAVAAAAMAAQAAKVAGIQGFADGGIVGQGSMATSGPDNTIIKARNGEAVLTADDQKELLTAIRSGSLVGGDIVVQVDGREIARAVRSQLQQGFRLA